MKKAAYYSIFIFLILTSCNENESTLPSNQCGNEILESGEQCDGTLIDTSFLTCPTGKVLAQTPVCTETCTLDMEKSCIASCGNGKLDENEECDAHLIDTSFLKCPTGKVLAQMPVCSNTCTLDMEKSCIASCGNGKLDENEECDGILFSMNTIDCVEGYRPKSELVCTTDCTIDMEKSCEPKACEVSAYPVTIKANEIEDLTMSNVDDSGEIGISPLDGYYSTSTINKLPYHLIEFIPDSSCTHTSLHYQGRTKTGERLAMYIYRDVDNKWVKVTGAEYDGQNDIQLDTEIVNSDYSDKKIRALVTLELAANGSDSILVTGDTQSYTTHTFNDDYKSGKSNGIYNQIMTYAKEQYLAGKIAYFHHTGDITDNCGSTDLYRKYEWNTADEAHKIIDEIGLPNGISPGNHDETPCSEKADEWYKKYFPASRYNQHFWYHSQDETNWNSYVLVTIANRDFIVVNAGWNSFQYDWINEVLNKYSHRIAIFGLHAYADSEDYITISGRRYLNVVIYPNPNIVLVLAGHVHERISRLIELPLRPGRMLCEMIIDYSDLDPDDKGADGYLRWITFKDGKIAGKTYSPYKDDWRTADIDPNDEYEFDFVLPDSSREIHTATFTAQKGM